MDAAILKELQRGGYVVEEDFDEVHFVRLAHQARKFSTGTFGLTIVPTMDCNLACTYCFETRKPVRLSDTTRAQVVTFVQNYLQQVRFKTLSVSWYGGEPLLEPELIKALSEQLIAVAEEGHLNYEASIVSNGTLVTDEAIQLLRDARIGNIQVTLDGAEDVHNRRRPFVGGGGTFELVIANIKRLASHFHVSVRMNVDRTNSDQCLSLLQTDESLRRLFVEHKCSLYFGFVRPFTSSCQCIAMDCFEPDEFWSLEQELAGEMKNLGIGHTEYPSLPGNCTAAMLHSFVIGPEGELYKCWDSVGDTREVIGHVSRPVEFTGKLMEWLSVELGEPGCLSCKYLPLCNGGCPHVVLNRRRNTVPLSMDCTKWRYQLDASLKQRYREHAKAKAGQGMEAK